MGKLYVSPLPDGIGNCVHLPMHDGCPDSPHCPTCPKLRANKRHLPVWENKATNLLITVEALRANPAYARARQKHEQELAHAEKVIKTIKEERQAAFAAIRELQQEKQPVTRSAVARRAGVSVVFLRSHPDLLHAIEEAEQRHRLAPPESAADKTKDQVNAALRRRLGDMRQQLAAKDRELRGKQREIDRLYGKLAISSPLTDVELRSAFADALNRLAQQEKQVGESN